MGEYSFGSRGRSQERKTHRNDGERIQYLLSAEEQLLRSISARAPLPEILHGICCALDCQIGNAVSLIFLPSDDASEIATIAENAALFGLHTLCSECILAENDELLGSLEMYCTDPRSLSAGEVQLIERAKCLAAIAIKLNKQTGHQSNRIKSVDGTERTRVLEWPHSRN
jgi:hypothetical protein